MFDVEHDEAGELATYTELRLRQIRRKRPEPPIASLAALTTVGRGRGVVSVHDPVGGRNDKYTLTQDSTEIAKVLRTTNAPKLRPPI